MPPSAYDPMALIGDDGEATLVFAPGSGWMDPGCHQGWTMGWEYVHT